MKIQTHLKTVAFATQIALLALSVGSMPSSADATTLTISANKRSDIKGWGVFPSFYNGSNASQNYFGNSKPAVRDAVYGLGQSFIRLELAAGYYRSGDATNSVSSITFNTVANGGGWPQDKIDYLVSELNIAKGKGVSKYILSSWSPPDDFKTVNTPTTTGFTLDPTTPIRYGKAKYSSGQWVRTRLRQDKEQAFCNWYVAGIKYLVQQTNWTPTMISLQNELSMWDISYNGCYWEADQYYRVAKLMRSTLNANGLSGVLIAGHDDTFKVTNTTDYWVSPAPVGIFEWGFPVLNPSNPRYDSALSSAIGAYAFHSYDINDQWGTVGGEDAVKTNGGPQRDVWMTEWNDHNDGTGDSGGTSEIDYTIKAFRHLACDFVTLPYNYWCYWTAFVKETGAVEDSNLLGSQSVNGISQPILSQKYPIFQKIFKTVTPGDWISKTVACDDEELKSKQDQYGQYKDNLVNLIAFEKNDATASLLVIANPSSNSRSNVIIEGLKGAGATVYLNTSSQTMSVAQSGATVAGRFTITTLPARSVVLVVANNPGTLVAGNIYKVIAVHSNKAMDANSDSSTDQVRQWTYNGGTNQRWKLETVSTDLYKLTAQSNQRSLAISNQVNNGLDPGCLTVSQTYTGAANQKFRIEKMPDGFFRITANASNFPLDVAGGSQDDGTIIGQWWDTGNTNQRWRFEAP